MMLALLPILACAPAAPDPFPVAPAETVGQQEITPEASSPELAPEPTVWRVEESTPAELGQPELTAQQLNSAGFHYYEQGDLYAAVLLFREATQRDPEHVLAHYNLACVLALVRRVNRGSACGRVEAYRSDILDHLEIAARLDPGRKRRMLEDPDLSDLRGLMRFRIIAGADLSDPAVLEDLLVGTHLVEPGMGAYGPARELLLREDHTWTIQYLPTAACVLDEIPAPVHGTWRLKGLTLHLDGEGDYAVRSEGALVRDGRVAWTEDPAECDA